MDISQKQILRAKVGKLELFVRAGGTEDCHNVPAFRELFMLRLTDVFTLTNFVQVSHHTKALQC
jgi:hypothetical protein